MKRRLRNIIIASLCWIYAILIVAAWLFLRWEGDRSWLGTIAIFSPRWLVLLPLVALLPLALALDRRSTWILAVTTLGALWGVMGLCLPWRTLLSPGRSAFSVRILTCNVHGHALNSRQLAGLIAAVHPDIVVLQEWLGPYESPLFGQDDWNVIVTGEECLATRFPIKAIKELQNGWGADYWLETSARPIDLFSVHLASPHPPLAAALLGLPQGKSELEKNVVDRELQAQQLHRLAQRASGPLLIAGDFNLCPDSPIFRENFYELADAFDTAGFGFGWSYRGRWTAVRIDHILSNQAWICRRCWLGPSVGSPHRPLIADFSLSTAR